MWQKYLKIKEMFNNMFEFAFIRRKHLSNADVSTLIDRFLDGATSPAEEKALYKFYADSPAGSLEDSLEQYRPMFSWYGSMTPASRRRPVWRYAGVAASVAVLTAAAFTVFGPAHTDSNGLYACYEGSYVVRDGRRISDLNAIHVQLARAEYTADSLLAAAERQADEIEYDPTEVMIDNTVAGISDSELAMQIRCDLLGIDYKE